MKALVTGIAGFAGNYLAKLLLDEGLDVYGISQESTFNPFLDLGGGKVQYTTLDIQNRPQVTSLMGEIRPDLVFHLAARSSPSQSVTSPIETFEVNFGGTLSLLEALRVQAIPCRFLMVSSSHVYGGKVTVQRVTERAPMRPRSPYAASKAAGEMVAFQYWKSYGIQTVIVRAFNHSGPGQGGGFVCPDLARKVVEIERGVHPPSLEIESLDREIDFSDVRDVVRGYYSALVKGTPGEIYNLCSGKGVTIRAIAENLVASAQKAITLAAPVVDNRGEEKRGMIGDYSLAARDFGWKPSIPFEVTVRQVLEYCRQMTKLPAQPFGPCTP